MNKSVDDELESSLPPQEDNIKKTPKKRAVAKELITFFILFFYLFGAM
jgi:hypothetical protein